MSVDEVAAVSGEVAAAMLMVVSDVDDVEVSMPMSAVELACSESVESADVAASIVVVASASAEDAVSRTIIKTTATKVRFA